MWYRIYILLTCLGFINLRAEVKSEIEWKPLSFGSGYEFGQLMNAKYIGQENVNVDRQFISRLSIYLNHHVIIQERLDLQVGVSGLFWYNFPEGSGGWGNMNTKFGPGISKAQAVYYFGKDKNSKNFMQLGFFPIKYNQDALNLGEYLFRSGTYPGFLRTGGWNILNSSSYLAQGFRLHFENFGGMISHDLLFHLEKEFWPLNDLTPSYMLTIQGGPVEVGMGISLHHYIPIRPSLLETKHSSNHYAYFPFFPATRANVVGGDTLEPAKSAGEREGLESDLILSKYIEVNSKGDSILISAFNEKYWRDTLNIHRNQPHVDILFSEINSSEFIWQDTVTGLLYTQAEIPVNAFGSPRTDSIWVKSSQKRYLETNTFRYPREDLYYTHKGVKLMGRASIDFKHILDVELKFFVEAAVLGVKNYPLFYEKLSKRIPIMFGLHIPSFGFFDKFSIQGEYYNSPHLNSLEQIYKEWFPLPPKASTGGKGTHRDNFHWSIFAKKKMMQGFSIFLQIASDHLRLMQAQDANVWPTFYTVTPESKHWYYMFKLEFGI